MPCPVPNRPPSWLALFNRRRLRLSANCGANEEWSACGTCEPNCGNLFPVCAAEPCAAKCICKNGFYRSVDGNCVDLQQCTIENDPCSRTRCAAGTVCLNWRRTCYRQPCRVGANCVKLSCLE